MSMAKDYPNPAKTFGTKYDQSSNQRRILICILNRFYLSKEFLKCGTKGCAAYFDLLESRGLVVLHDTSRRYEAEGYMVSPDKVPEVKELRCKHGKEPSETFPCLL